MHGWKLELDKALELADETLALAEKVKDPAMLLSGNLARGATLFYLGKFVFANEHLEKALTIFDLWQPLSEELEFRRIASFGYLSLGLYAIGYPDQARAKSREMLAVAQRSSLPFVLANAYGHAAAHNLVTRNGAAAQRQNEESLALAQEMGIVSFLAVATVRRGASLIAQERFEEGIASLREGITAILATGGTPPALFWCFLASGLGRIGRPQEGLEVVEGGFASVAKTGEQNASPLLHDVKGELLLAQNSSDGAKAELCFRAAIEIARRQSARMSELRATTSLARLLAKQGRPDEARTLLAEIYVWFTEGFDTADLKDAKALLDALTE